MYPNLEQLYREIPNSKQHLLKHITFTIIRPDALARGYERDLLREFSELGFYTIGFKYQFVDERQMEEVYRYTQHKILEKQKRPLWWMTREMYRISPALLVLLVGHYPKEFEDCAQYFDSLKGPSNPALTKPEHIRYRYRAMNVVLCIIHSSDNAEQSLRELRIFFSRDEFLAMLEHVPDALDGRLSMSYLYLEQSVDRWYGKTRRPGSFFEVLTIVKIRTLAHLLEWKQFGLPVKLLRELYDQMLEVVDQHLPYVEEAEAIQKLLERELLLLNSCDVNKMVEPATHPIKCLEYMAQRDLPLLLQALRWMADYKNFETIPFLTFKEILRRNLVMIDKWESLVIETSFVFHLEQLRGYYVSR